MDGVQETLQAWNRKGHITDGEGDKMAARIRGTMWTDFRAIAFYASWASLLLLVVEVLLLRKRRIDSWKVGHRGHLPSQLLQWSRWFSAGVVVLLTVAAAMEMDFQEPVYLLLLVAMTYAYLLLTASFIFTSRLYLSTHAAVIHVVALTAFIIRDLVPRATSGAPHESSVLVYALIVALAVTGLLIPGLVPKEVEDEEEPNPSRTASIISYLTFSFLDPLFLLARRKGDLDACDLSQVLPNEKAKYLKETSFPVLDPMISKKPSRLLWGILWYFARDFAAQAIFLSFTVVTGFAGPVAILHLLAYFEAKDRTNLLSPWVWILCLGLVPVIRAIVTHQYLSAVTHIMIRLEVILNQLVFDHALRVRINTASPELSKKEKKAKVSGKSKLVDSRAEMQPSLGTGNTQEPAAVSTHDNERTNAHPRDGSTSEASGNGTSETSTVVSSNASVHSDTGPSNTATPSKDKEIKKASPEEKVASQAGGVSNLLTVDMKNVTDAVDMQGVSAFFSILINFALLYSILEWSALIGIGILVISIPIPGYLIKFRTGLQKKQMKKSDERLTAVTQTMNVLRMIKLFGWESQIEKKISESREAELKFVWRADILDTGSSYLVAFFPLFAMLATFSCYTLVIKRPLNASLIFSSIALFDMLRNGMYNMIYWMPSYVKGKVSVDRLDAFLNTGEPLVSHHCSDMATSGAPDSSTIIVKNAVFLWKAKPLANAEVEEESRGRRPFQLRIDKELAFLSGHVNLITGPTACGKTSLLMSLLGETVFEGLGDDSFCQFPREGGVAYAAQESWVINDTIKRKGNILFGAEYQDERYSKVLRQTALEKDLAMFDAGDMTEVGEKGITLSGGQKVTASFAGVKQGWLTDVTTKARITLARAVYSAAQTVLLDDVLSALDVHTSRWVVRECLGGDLLRGRTVLLVTHNVLLASTAAKYLVTLRQDGTIKSQGPIEEILRENATLYLSEADELEPQEKQESIKETTDEAKAKESKGKLILVEEKAMGRVTWPAFSLYLRALGGPVFFIVSFGALVITRLLPIALKGFLAYWSHQYDVMPVEDVPVKRYLLGYFALALVEVVFGFGAWIIYLRGVIRASMSIHQILVRSIMTCTLRWLDTTPTSRVITRCSQDMNAIDNMIPSLLNNVVGMGAGIAINAVTVVVVAGWQMLLPAFAIVVVGLTVARLYMAAQLPVKRLMSNAKSPIVGHIQNALVGLVSIRAYGAQSTFQQSLVQKLDSYSVTAHLFWDLNRWIGIRIDFLGAAFTSSIAIWLVYGVSVSSSTIGFSLTVLAGFNFSLLMWVRMYNSLEVQGNSLERIRDYLVMEHEAPPSEEGRPPAYWPASGGLRVESLSARYSPDGPEVLKDVSFNVLSGERIGIVGRTGAGKSTLGLALLRAIPTNGRVFLDERDIAATNLDALRSSISIIPQSPELLAGTLRENLDPTGEHNDAILNDALSSAGLGHLKSEDGKDNGVIGLDTSVESGGSNFSQGQRQIIALARAFVRKSKLLVMDEATASIDYNTDHLIQEFIRSEFKDVTVITVAHRLQTIMTSDKILVLDAGRVVEWGSPKQLLRQSSGFFKSMVDESGDKVELYEAAGIE